MSAAATGFGTGAGAHGLSWGQIWTVLQLADYNTRVVVLGTMMLGLAAGLIGTYMLLRKRALIGDALSHATLPGIAIAFMAMVALGGDGKYLPGLLVGAVVTGMLGVGAILLIKGLTRIKEDAALGIVLSVSFGLGIALLAIIQKMPTGRIAGLDSFIYGKTASMVLADAWRIGSVALVAAVTCVVLYKEFTILSFDGAFAASQGWPVVKLDIVMMTLVTAVTVIGLQAVGLILVIALLIIPAAAARFWTNHLRTMLLASGLIGAVSGYLGAGISALLPRLPTGAIIVVIAGAIFLVSMLLGTQRGIVRSALAQRRLRRSVARQHLLRAMYEWIEEHDALDRPARTAVPRAALAAARTWSMPQLARVLRRVRREGLVDATSADGPRLTDAGYAAAARLARNHRLWELYLIRYADIAPSHVDRDADQIEHVLGPAMVRELAAQLDDPAPAGVVPPSPHRVEIGDAP